jgi:hypothetical protein
MSDEQKSSIQAIGAESANLVATGVGLKKAEIEVGLRALAHNLNHCGLARGY